MYLRLGSQRHFCNANILRHPLQRGSIELLPAFFIFTLLLDHVMILKLLPGYTNPYFLEYYLPMFRWVMFRIVTLKLDYHLYNLSKEVSKTKKNTLNCKLIQSEEREKGYFE